MPTFSSRDLRLLRVRIAGTALPVSKQVKMRTVPTSEAGTVTEFLFPFAPTITSYEQLAPEFVEIERPGRQAIVEMKKFNLLSVTMRFLVAVPLDGVRVSIDNELRVLRAMANSVYPVAFTNMDNMLTNPFNIRRTGTQRNRSAFFFRITDLSFESLRRNLDNRITAAEVSMSLIEVANPNVNVVSFPTITYPDLVAPSTTATKTTASNPDTPYNDPVAQIIVGGRTVPRD